MKKLHQFAVSSSFVPFGNIRHDRDRGSLELILESVVLGQRPVPGQPVNLDHHLLGRLPDFHVFKLLGLSHNVATLPPGWIHASIFFIITNISTSS